MVTMVIPAYGRTYDSSSDILADWEAGKDFKMVGGPYINKEDAKMFNHTEDEIFVKTKKFTVKVL